MLARAVAIAAYRNGGDDLHIYVYFSRLLVHDHNPFSAPEAGAIDPRYGDNPLGELALYAGLLWLHDAATTLRVLFVCADVGSLLSVAFLFRRPVWWRKHVMLFLAFNPFVLLRWTVFAEDKTVLFLAFVLLVASLERESQLGAWAATAVLGILKWIAFYIVLPLTAFTIARRGARAALVSLGLCFGAIAVTTIPYFPDSLRPFERRQDRLEVEPDHESVTRFLDAVGLWDPWVVKIFVPAALLAIVGLFLAGRLDVREAVILSFAASLVLLPDSTRVEFIALPFLFITRLTSARLLVLWGASVAGVVAKVVTSSRFEQEAKDGLPLGSLAMRVVGSGESLRFVFLTNLLLFVMLTLYAADRLRGRVDDPLSRSLRLRQAATRS